MNNNLKQSSSFTYRGVIVGVSDGLMNDEVSAAKVRELVAEYIDTRLISPLVITPHFDDDTFEIRHYMQFADTSVLRKLSGPCLCVDVALEDCNGHLLCTCGVQPEEVTEDDIETAKKFWLEPVWVSRWGTTGDIIIED